MPRPNTRSRAKTDNQNEVTVVATVESTKERKPRATRSRNEATSSTAANSRSIQNSEPVGRTTTEIVVVEDLITNGDDEDEVEEVKEVEEVEVEDVEDEEDEEDEEEEEEEDEGLYSGLVSRAWHKEKRAQKRKMRSSENYAPPVSIGIRAFYIYLP